MKIDVSPTELSFIATALNDKIAALDAVGDRLFAERERLGGGDIEAETIGFLVRAEYARIVRRVEQRLDEPFVDQDEAIRMLFGDGAVAVGVRS